MAPSAPSQTRRQIGPVSPSAIYPADALLTTRRLFPVGVSSSAGCLVAILIPTLGSLLSSLLLRFIVRTPWPGGKGEPYLLVVRKDSACLLGHHYHKRPNARDVSPLGNLSAPPRPLSIHTYLLADVGLSVDVLMSPYTDPDISCRTMR